MSSSLTHLSSDELMIKSEPQDVPDSTDQQSDAGSRLEIMTREPVLSHLNEGSVRLNGEVRVELSSDMTSNVCSVCDKWFISVPSLNRHKRRIHGITQPCSRRYHCTECKKMFIIKSQYNMHMLRVHHVSNGGEAFPIKLTTKSSASRSTARKSAQRDWRIGSLKWSTLGKSCDASVLDTSDDGFKFWCHACQKSFVNPWSLNRHGATQHGIYIGATSTHVGHYSTIDFEYDELGAAGEEERTRVTCSRYGIDLRTLIRQLARTNTRWADLGGRVRKFVKSSLLKPGPKSAGSAVSVNVGRSKSSSSSLVSKSDSLVTSRESLVTVKESKPTESAEPPASNTEITRSGVRVEGRVREKTVATLSSPRGVTGISSPRGVTGISSPRGVTGISSPRGVVFNRLRKPAHTSSEASSELGASLTPVGGRPGLGASLTPVGGRPGLGASLTPMGGRPGLGAALAPVGGRPGTRGAARDQASLPKPNPTHESIRCVMLSADESWSREEILARACLTFPFSDLDELRSVIEETLDDIRDVMIFISSFNMRLWGLEESPWRACPDLQDVLMVLRSCPPPWRTPQLVWLVRQKFPFENWEKLDSVVEDWVVRVKRVAEFLLLSSVVKGPCEALNPQLMSLLKAFTASV